MSTRVTQMSTKLNSAYPHILQKNSIASMKQETSINYNQGNCS